MVGHGISLTRKPFRGRGTLARTEILRPSVKTARDHNLREDGPGARRNVEETRLIDQRFVRTMCLQHGDRRNKPGLWPKPEVATACIPASRTCEWFDFGDFGVLRARIFE